MMGFFLSCRKKHEPGANDFEYNRTGHTKRHLWSGEPRARSSMIIHDLSSLKATALALAQENESNVFLTSCRLNAQDQRNFCFGSWPILFDTPHRLHAARDFTDYQSLRAMWWSLKCLPHFLISISSHVGAPLGVDDI